MCVIVYCKNGNKPTNEVLSSCWDSNSHGVGFAIRRGRKITFRKGLMTKEKAIATIEPIKRFDELVIHFRMASAGFVCKEMTHPFNKRILLKNELSGKSNFLFFHNGHDHAYATIGQKQGWTDSAVAAILAENDELPNNFSGKVLLMKEEKTELIGSFEEKDNILYSNTWWSWRKNTLDYYQDYYSNYFNPSWKYDEKTQTSTRTHSNYSWVQEGGIWYRVVNGKKSEWKFDPEAGKYILVNVEEEQYPSAWTWCSVNKQYYRYENGEKVWYDGKNYNT